MTTDFIIVGGGPAGLSAALFLAKAKRSVTVIHKGTSPLIQSFQWLLPGVPFEATAMDWLKTLRVQAESLGVSIVEDQVIETVLGASEKKIVTAGGKTLDASSVILATGCYDRHGFIDGEEKFVGHGVFYNAYQDGMWFEGKSLVVEGKNEQAIREALYLARFAAKIYFVVPAMKLEGDSKLLDAISKNEKVEGMLSASIKKIEGGEAIESVSILCAGEERKVEATGVFLYSRPSTPSYAFLKGTVQISPEGCLMVDENFMTSIPGVFACGDILSGIPQLPFVSAAQGVVAALQADRYLASFIS